MHCFCRWKVSSHSRRSQPRSSYFATLTGAASFACAKPAAMEPTVWRVHRARSGTYTTRLRSNRSLRSAQGYPFHEGPLTCLAISSSGSTAITGSEDTTAKLSSLASGKARAAFHGVLSRLGAHAL